MYVCRALWARVALDTKDDNVYNSDRVDWTVCHLIVRLPQVIYFPLSVPVQSTCVRRDMTPRYRVTCTDDINTVFVLHNVTTDIHKLYMYLLKHICVQNEIINHFIQCNFLKELKQLRS